MLYLITDHTAIPGDDGKATELQYTFASTCFPITMPLSSPITERLMRYQLLIHSVAYCVYEMMGWPERTLSLVKSPPPARMAAGRPGTGSVYRAV